MDNGNWEEGHVSLAFLWVWRGYLFMRLEFSWSCCGLGLCSTFPFKIGIRGSCIDPLSSLVVLLPLHFRESRFDLLTCLDP